MGNHARDGDPAPEKEVVLGIICPGASRQPQEGRGMPRVSLPPSQTCCRDCSSPASQAGCRADMGCPRRSTSLRVQEKMQGLFGSSKRCRKPHGGPQGPFLQLLLSPPLRHLIQAALSARVSAGPRPTPSLTVTFCKLGQGTMLASGVVSPWGAPLSLGAAAEPWGGHLAGPFLAQGPVAISLPGSAKLMQRLCPRHSAWPKCIGGREGFHSSCTVYMR